jgi:hypothetical protein
LGQETSLDSGPSNFRVSVVSHDEQLLDAVALRPFIKTVLLSDLNIPEEYRSESLAENRYLVGNDWVDESFDFYGFASARWNDRFPSWPKLENLDNLVAKLPEDSNSIYLAPICWRLSSTQVPQWINDQDLLHPGMSEILKSLTRFNSMDFTAGHTYSLVMGNNFVVPKGVAFDFLEFWHKSFQFLTSQYELNFPFGYRCHICGLQSEWGIDRWTRTRHSGFLMERVSALFFLSRPDLIPVNFRRGSWQPVKKRLFNRDIGTGLKFSIFANRFVHLGNPCRGRHNEINKE